MTRTGTKRRDKFYTYYSCAGCQQKGTTVCKGRHIPMGILDDIVVENLKKRLLAPDRMAALLQGLADRQAAKGNAVNQRILALQGEVTECEERLKRLYRSIEDDIVELDDILRDRISSLKAERERAKAALDRARAQTGAAMTIDAERIQAFSRLMTEKLDNGDVNSRKAYIRSIVSTVEVDDHAVRIIGSPAVLSAAIAGRQTANSNVRGFAREWRARKDSNLRPPDS